MERRLGLREFQTDGTDTEKARNAKLELTAGLKNWWAEEDLSCLVGWWLEKNILKISKRTLFDLVVATGYTHWCAKWPNKYCRVSDLPTARATPDRFLDGIRLAVTQYSDGCGICDERHSWPA